MGGAVVENQVYPPDVLTPQAPKERAEKGLKFDEPFPLEAAGQSLAGRHQQGREQLQGAASVVAVADPQRPARAAGRGVPSAWRAWMDVFSSAQTTTWPLAANACARS
jgi:hypothetical protein